MRSLLLAISVFVFFQASMIAAQNQTGTIRVQVRAAGKPVENAEVVVAGTTYRTDGSGTTTVTAVPGTVELTVVKTDFAPATASVQVAAGGVQEVFVELQRQPTVEETVTVVASTRTDKRLEDQPMRVEVLAREEIEEKMLMTPGDIVMMLNEMGGMRVQATSPSLGAASVRIQGMRGRYTRVLSDGLPLFGDVGGLGLLQIPPMDLGQVEVIKGVASALYGAGAMGGVINLLSRRPAGEPAQEFLLNQSTRGATDAVTFLSAPLSRGWSTSVLGGGHWQQTTDVNDDAWADLPGYQRAVVRPRLFWDGGNGRTFFATTGFTYEDRNGGTPDGQVLAATGQPYVEALETQTVRRWRGWPVPCQGAIRGDRPGCGRPPEPRSSVWRSPGARSARYGLRRTGRSWNGGSSDVGRRTRDRTRRLHGARRPPIRLRLHGAGSIRPVRRQRDAGVVGIVEWPAGRP